VATEGASGVDRLSLQMSLFISSLLFPLLSGIGVSQLERSLLKRSNSRRLRAQLAGLRADRDALLKQRREGEDRLTQLAAEAAKSMSALGETMDSVGLYMQKLAMLAAPDDRKQLEAAAAALASTPTSLALQAFLAALGPAAGGAARQFERDYYSRLLAAAVGSRHESQFAVLKQSLGQQVEEDVKGGHEHGESIGPIIFNGSEKSGLIKLVELKKFRNMFFSKDNNENPTQGGR